MNIVRIAIRALRLMPAAIERGHLKWALSSLQQRDPMHQDLPFIIRRIRELEDCHG